MLTTPSSGNSTVEKAINAPPAETLAQKWEKLPQTAKIGVYAGAGGAAALLLFALTCTCIRQRKKGRQERDAYNAKVEKEREDAYRDQIQLREKGLGGWDKGAYEQQGEDALGGWGGTHVPAGTRASQLPPMPQSPHSPRSPSSASNFDLNRAPTVPAVGGFAPPARVLSPAQMQNPRSPSPGIQRNGTPVLQQPAPRTPQQAWDGQNAYSDAHIPTSPGFMNQGSQRSLTNPVPGSQAMTGNFPARSFSGSNGYQRF